MKGRELGRGRGCAMYLDGGGCDVNQNQIELLYYLGFCVIFVKSRYDV